MNKCDKKSRKIKVGSDETPLYCPVCGSLVELDLVRCSIERIRALLGNVQVVYGAEVIYLHLAGCSVAEIQAALRDETHIDMDALAIVDGQRVADKSQKVEAGQSLEFLANRKPTRRKANRRKRSG